MGQKNVRYPHTIGFRVTDETWFAIQREISNTDLTPHDWCRQVVLDRLDREQGFSKKERLLFHQVLRTHYLIVQGFHILADNKLTTGEWRKIREYAKEKGDYFAQQALSEFQKKRESKASS